MLKSKQIYTAVVAAGLLTAGILLGCTDGRSAGKKPVTKPNFTVDTTVSEGDSIRIPDLIGEKAVLQQNAVLTFWGICSLDGPVAVCVNDVLYYGRCSGGSFELLIQTPAASENNTITVYTETEKKTISDV